MFKNLLLILIVTSLLIIPGCSGYPDGPALQGSSGELSQNTDGESRPPIPKTITPESLGGICLGDSLEDVTGILGQGYTEAQITDEAGYIGEEMIELSFNSGIVVTLGKESGRVIRVVSQSPGFQTYLGIQVGDQAEPALNKYRTTFKEATSRHDNSTLTGWYHVGAEKVIIFDFDKEDGTRVNSDVHPGSTVQEIVLGCWKHFD